MLYAPTIRPSLQSPLGRTLIAAGDNLTPPLDHSLSFLTIQMGLVSVRGALGFFRLQSPSTHAPIMPQPPGRLPSHVCGGNTNGIKGGPTGYRLTRLHVIKPSLNGLLHPLAGHRSLSVGPTTPIQAQVELTVLEGSSVHLNLALFGYEQHLGRTLQAESPSRLKLQWTRNGQSINGARFGPIRLINRLDQSGSSLNQVTLLDHKSNPATTTDNRPPSSQSVPASQTQGASLDPNQEDAYVLANFLDERLNPSPASSRPQRVVDDFLADGRAPNWARFEAYAHSQLGIGYNWSNQREGLEMDDSCKITEQISVVQVSLDNIKLDESGLYEVSVCLAPSANRDGSGTESELGSASGTDDDEMKNVVQCQLASNFFLKTVEDLPQLGLHLATMDQSAILNPGDRLSIKCEASGFTLPQINWYLDGRRLSEHSFSSETRSRLPIGIQSSKDLETSTIQAEAEMDSDEQEAGELANEQASMLAGWQSRLRIGDYVSQQDQHVHSFVNSSQLQVNDGGFYKCVANNGHRQVERELRVDVRGPPMIARRLANRSILAGSSQLYIQCPYSGYPVAAIEWYYWRPSQQQNLVSRSRLKRRPDDERDPDPERDEWLSQASAMTALPDVEELPEPLPDYPSPIEGQSSLEFPALDGEDVLEEADYSGLDVDFGSSIPNGRLRLQKRAVSQDEPAGWLKLPQARRHQVHPNGTLILQDIQRSDQGFYKCRVLASSTSSSSSSGVSQQHSATSNQFYLTVLVAPVISPFASADSLREGMRNFLTCSVIEGDPPIHLSWFKDGRPIEQHIAEDSESSLEMPLRIRVETSNEYTSTLYFSRVEFKDNGNYTCMAANKAASVNYTANMLVNVPPKWTLAPKDVECVAGQSIVINCQAQANPNPRIWWELGLASSSHTAELAPVGGGSSRQHSKLQTEPQLQAQISPTSSSGSSSSQQQITGNSLQYNHHHHHHHQQQQQQYAPIHYRTIISNSRIHILENASLVIRDVNPADQGYYLCQAANNFGSLSSLIKLTVNVGASFASKFQTKYVKLLDKVELDCDPLGQSVIEVVWMQKSLASGHLNLNQTLGKHYMSFESSNTSRRLFVTQIRTEFVPSNDPQMLSDTEISRQQQLAQYPPDNSLAFELHPYRRANLGSEELQSELVRLVIKQARRQHSSDFVCRASNQYGADEKVIRLLVQEAPEAVQEINVLQIESRSASLSWAPPYNGNSPITSYLVQWAPLNTPMITSGDQSSVKPSTQTIKWSQMTVQQPSATIESLLPLTSYEIRIRAQNQFGLSPLVSASPTGFGLVSTLEEPPSGPPTDIRGVALSSSSIQLSWLPTTFSGANDVGNAPGGRFTVKGYYLGYKPALSNDSYVFKTVSLDSRGDGTGTDHLLATSEIQLQSSRGSGDPKELLSNITTIAEQKPGPRLKVIVDDLQRSTKYMLIVTAYNSAGPGPQSDPLEIKTLVDDPPPLPQIRVGMVAYTSIELQWSFSSLSSESGLSHSKNTPSSSGPMIDGYLLYYRRSSSGYGDESNWLERRLTSDTHTLMPAVPAANSRTPEYSLVERQLVTTEGVETTLTTSGSLLRNSSLAHKSFRFILDQLSCGSPYQVYLVAYNSIGTGQPSQILRTKTRGSAPIAPRKQDYIGQINSTLVQLNLDTWMDGGCSITNFEIKYKPAATGSPDYTSIDQGRKATDTQKIQDRSEPQPFGSWILVSSNINPDQQNLEIRDLKPETWYTLLTRAESSAGQTEVQYTFMTLDRFGQVPIAALESGPSNLPSLFRGSNGSMFFRSFMANFTTSSGYLSPLVLSACSCLIVLATCSIVLIRKYHNMSENINLDHTDRDFCDDGKHSVSNMDCRRSTINHYETQYHQDHLHMQLKAGTDFHKANVSPQIVRHEHCSGTGSSPCKTTTTVVTNSSCSNGSSASSQLNQSNIVLPVGVSYYTVSDQQSNQDPTATCNQLAVEGKCQTSDGDYCLSPRMLLCDSPSKFATINREAIPSEPILNKFKTLPYPAGFARQINTFQTPLQPVQHNQQQAVCSKQPDMARQLHQDHDLKGEHKQQIYSKLKQMCQTNSHYNLCQEAHTQAQARVEAHHQAMCNQNLTYNLPNLGGNQSKLFLDSSACHHMRTNDICPMQSDNHAITQALSCDESHQTGLDMITNCPRQYQVGEEIHRLNYNCVPLNIPHADYLDHQQPAQLHLTQSNAYGTYGGLGSGASGSTVTFTTNSSIQQTGSSNSNCQVANEQQQLIDLANGNQNDMNIAQCPNHLKVNQRSFQNGNCQVGPSASGSDAQAQQNTTSPLAQPTNEQSDYALPFPPKWV